MPQSTQNTKTFSEWDFGFEADAAQRTIYSELVKDLERSIRRHFQNGLAVYREERRQRRATPRFSDVVRAGWEAADKVDNKGRPTLEDLQRENRENDRRRDDRHGRQP